MRGEYNNIHAFNNTSNLPAANSSAVVTLAARTGYGERRYVRQIDVSLEGTITAAAVLTVTGLDDADYSISFPIIATGHIGQLGFAEPLRGLPNGAVVVTLTTGGAGATGKINVIHDV